MASTEVDAHIYTCAPGRIRTCVARRRVVYSHVRLTAPPPTQYFFRSYVLLRGFSFYQARGWKPSWFTRLVVSATEVLASPVGDTAASEATRVREAVAAQPRAIDRSATDAIIFLGRTCCCVDSHSTKLVAGNHRGLLAWSFLRPKYLRRRWATLLRARPPGSAKRWPHSHVRLTAPPQMITNAAPLLTLLAYHSALR